MRKSFRWVVKWLNWVSTRLEIWLIRRDITKSIRLVRSAQAHSSVYKECRAFEYLQKAEHNCRMARLALELEVGRADMEMWGIPK